jgi:hypothetical protein
MGRWSRPIRGSCGQWASSGARSTCAVAVPSLDHLARVFLAAQRLEYEAGAHVLAVRPDPRPDGDE